MDTYDIAGLLNRTRAAIGRERQGLATPALLLDLDALHRNIATMACRMPGPTRIRPHAKSHKCAQIARLQIEAGAIGITTATVWEAVALGHADIDRLLIANQVVGEAKIDALAEAARDRQIIVAVDDAGNADALSTAACAAGSEIGVLLDVDVGMNRCGVRTQEQALSLAQHIERAPGLRLRGVMGYEGHSVLERERSVRTKKAQAAMEALLATADRLTHAGLPIEIVSAGGTGTFDITGRNARVTEIQAGSYALMDATRLAVVSDFAPALTVLTTVASRQGTTLVLDSGRKTVGVEFTLPFLKDLPPDQATPRAAAEEHLLFDVTPACPLAVGDRVEVVPGYCPTTVNLHPVYHVVQNGVVVDIWPVLARGAGDGSGA